MTRIDREVNALSSRLQANLLAFSGEAAGPAPGFRWQLLLPVAVIVGAVVLFSVSRKARQSLLLEMILLGAAHLLQEGVKPGSFSPAASASVPRVRKKQMPGHRG